MMPMPLASTSQRSVVGVVCLIKGTSPMDSGMNASLAKRLCPDKPELDGVSKKYMFFSCLYGNFGQDLIVRRHGLDSHLNA